MDPLHYYTRPQIKSALLRYAANREIAVRYDKGFGKRPDVLLYEQDVVECAKDGATSFHVSEERWSNPSALSTGLKKKELDALRVGWDLILDIDCPYWPLAKLFTHLFVQALAEHNVVSSVKFSGNKGFHIAVPYEVFPTTINKQPTNQVFPDGPRKIAQYLLHYIVKKYVHVKGEEIIIAGKLRMTAEELAKLTKKPVDEFIITKSNKKGSIVEVKKIFNPLSLIGLDTILIAPRHLYRMPYSLHEKSGLASLPFATKDILSFEKTNADPEKVLALKELPDFSPKAIPGSAAQLLIESLDHQPVTEEKKERKPIIIDGEAIPEEYFPDCIKKLLAGQTDGRKRALFILINFLASCGWNQEMIEKRINEWNASNTELLRENYVHGQLRYHKQRKQIVLPPNCDKYYADLGVKCPDGSCSGSNPVTSAKRRFLARKKKRKKQPTHL